MDKNKKYNFKKLLCYNIVNNMKCVYKNKCMFAHNIEEQLKENNREFIYNMIYEMSDLSNINLKDNKELFEELLIFTKECKNCLNKKCPGGYNCKFGVCTKQLKICYNDLLNGKCSLNLDDENENGKIIKRCINGIHLTEKNLIPYYQRITCEINILDYGVFLFNDINYYSKINTLSIMLNDHNIKFVKNFITKNKINKNDLGSMTICNDKFNINYLLNNSEDYILKNEKDDIFENEQIIEEYQKEKMNDSIEGLNEYFWRFNNYTTNKYTDNINIENNNQNIQNNENNNFNDNDDINVKIKNIIDMINNYDNVIETAPKI